MKQLLRKLKWKFQWLNIYDSPFKRPSISLYVGKTRIGVPYFLPRKWVKFDKEDCLRQAKEDCNKPGHINYGFDPESVAHQYARWNKAVPLTIGFSSCSLGWKTKYSDTNFRHEWDPVWSFVFFGYQIAIRFGNEHGCHYWEPWLYYHYATSHDLSKKQRIELCMKEYPQLWRVYSNGDEGMINYYELILKRRYLKSKQQ